VTEPSERASMIDRIADDTEHWWVYGRGRTK